MTPSSVDFPANRLIEALPPADRLRFLADCEPVELAFDDVLAVPGERILHVYFPTNAMICLLATTPGHASLEVGLIGNEGMLGVPLVLGTPLAPQRATVQGGGLAWRMASAPFHRALEHSAPLRAGLMRYIQVVLEQLAQSAACNRFHVVEARLARWLLMTQDRVLADEFYLTHALLSQMLGVRRVGVTKAATALQARGLIRYRRGHVGILDRAGLMAASCACYASDQAAYARMRH